jgi:hypothetical protein
LSSATTCLTLLRFGETYRLHLQDQSVSQARDYIMWARRHAGHLMTSSCLVMGTHTSNVSLLYCTCAEAADLPSLVSILYKVRFVRHGELLSCLLFFALNFFLLPFVRDLPQTSILQCGIRPKASVMLIMGFRDGNYITLLTQQRGSSEYLYSGGAWLDCKSGHRLS